jgi:glycosyltransferase involved in cell wall biosynthesis
VTQSPSPSSREVAYVLLGDIRYISRAKKQAATLRDAGFSVTFHNGVFAQDPAYGDIGYPVCVSRVPETRVRSANFVRLLAFNRAVARQVLAASPAVVVCRELSTLPAGAIVKRARPNTRLIFDNNELSVETFAGVKRPVWRFIQHQCLPYCDVIVHAEASRMKYYVERYGEHGHNLVVENFPFRNPSVVEVPDDRLRAVYFGAVMPARGLEELIAAFERDPAASLDIRGPGPDDYVRHLSATVPAEARARIRVLPPVGDEQLYETLRGYNTGVAFYPLSGGLNNVFCAPNKVYQYLQAGLALITTPNPGLQRLIDEHQVGACVRDLSTNEIATAIQRVRSAALYRNITDDVRRRFCWEAVAPRFLAALG